MNTLIQIKVDNRFKDGNVRRDGNRLRGNKKTVSIEPMDTTNAPIEMQLNPPLVVTASLFEAMRKNGLLE